MEDKKKATWREVGVESVPAGCATTTTTRSHPTGSRPLCIAVRAEDLYAKKRKKNPEAGDHCGNRPCFGISWRNTTCILNCVYHGICRVLYIRPRVVIITFSRYLCVIIIIHNIILCSSAADVCWRRYNQCVFFLIYNNSLFLLKLVWISSVFFNFLHSYLVAVF